VELMLAACEGPAGEDAALALADQEGMKEAPGSSGGRQSKISSTRSTVSSGISKGTMDIALAVAATVKR
jgi:hypothetical protein